MGNAGVDLGNNGRFDDLVVSPHLLRQYSSTCVIRRSIAGQPLDNLVWYNAGEENCVPLADTSRTSDDPGKGLARMAQVTLERILQKIKTLEPEELLQVQQAIQARLAPADYSPEEERVLQEMLKVGLLTEIKRRRTDRQVAYPLVPIQGKPLSETILEERR